MQRKSVFLLHVHAAQGHFQNGIIQEPNIHRHHEGHADADWVVCGGAQADTEASWGSLYPLQADCYAAAAPSKSQPVRDMI